MLRRKELDSGITAVVFTVPERRLSEMEVATGPCVPVRNMSKALVPPLRQAIGETPQQTTALFGVLTGRRPGNALIEVARAGSGVLYRFSDEFVDAMADANEMLKRLSDEDEARGDGDYTTVEAKSAELDKAWLADGDWPKSVASTGNRLTRLAWANEARDLSQPLYCWFGPSVSRTSSLRFRPSV